MRGQAPRPIPPPVEAVTETALEAREISLAAEEVKGGKLDEPLLLEEKPGATPRAVLGGAPVEPARDVPAPATSRSRCR